MTISKLLCTMTVIIAGLFIQPAIADTVTLKPGHPDRHVVVKGDTLWDISAMFLDDPWRWPEIWQINPAIKNPHLIFPGDIIILDFVKGKPVIRVQRTRTIKLSPRVRASKRDEDAITVLPSNMIKQFLKYPRIVSQQELENAAYIVASEDGGLISATSDKIYARGLRRQDLGQYDIVREGKTYYGKGGWHKEVLGHEVLRIAAARLEQFADPATLVITDANREILIGDRLLPASFDKELDQDFLPHAPDQQIRGTIIAVLDGVSRIGQFHTVVLDLGKRDGMEPGHILAVSQSGKVVRDTVTDKWNNKVTLPDIRAGTVMIITSYERLSYALVMEANRDIKVSDAVMAP